MVLGQGEQSIPNLSIIGAIIDGCAGFAFTTGLLDISLDMMSHSVALSFALCSCASHFHR